MVRRRAAWPLLYAALVLVAVVVVVGPGALAWDDAFIAWPVSFPASIAPGDHLQMSYYLWLWEHALATFDHLPWFDPFQFAAGGHAGAQPFGWPLVLVSLPVGFLFGPVAAYNALVVVAFVACAAATYALARRLGTSQAAAAVAGFAFAFAPFRLVQATAHVNALLAPLLPLLLYCAERALRGDERTCRRWAWATAGVQVSIMGSGELHLAVFGAALVAVYVAVRAPGAPAGRLRHLAVPGAALVGGSAVVGGLMYAFVLEPSVAAGGRTLEETATFAPRLADLVTRDVAWVRFERYAYPGLVIAALALVGAVAAWRTEGRRLLGAGLAALALVPLALALAPGLVGRPLVQDAYRAIPLLSFSRVPGRILIVSALALAVLAALALDLVRRDRLRWALAAVAVAALVADAPDGLFDRNPAGLTAASSVPPGSTVLDLPPFDPGDYAGSVYTFGLTRSPGPRPGGYSPFVTPGARRAQAWTAPLGELPVDPCRWQGVVDDLGIDHVAVHLDLYGTAAPEQWPADGAALSAALARTPGFTEVARGGEVVLLAVDAGALACPG
jgi:hypothetical protein